MNLCSEPIITFIIPSVARETLAKTIESLFNQTINSWKCIIVFDGVQSNLPNSITSDERLLVIECDKKGSPPNSAGNVRNQAFPLVSSKWIGFVDDDDILDPKYVDQLIEEENVSPNAECIIFRMMDRNGLVIPTMKDKNIIPGHVGISFCIQKKISLTYQFENSSHEDFCFLKKLQMTKVPIVISPYITYFVQTNIIETKKMVRSYLNF